MPKFQTTVLLRNTPSRFWSLSFEFWDLFGFWDLLFGILYPKKFMETESLAMKLHSFN